MNVELTIFDTELNGSPFSNNARPRLGRPRKDEIHGASASLRETLDNGMTSAALAAAAVGAIWQGRDHAAVPAAFPQTVFNEVAGSRGIGQEGHAASSRYVAITNDAAPSATELGWMAYLREIVDYVAREQHMTATQIWERLRTQSSRFPLPHAGVIPDGRFAMAWDVGHFHLDVEVNRDGSFDWFYLDRDSREAEDGERCTLKGLGALERRARQIVG